MATTQNGGINATNKARLLYSQALNGSAGTVSSTGMAAQTASAPVAKATATSAPTVSSPIATTQATNETPAFDPFKSIYDRISGIRTGHDTTMKNVAKNVATQEKNKLYTGTGVKDVGNEATVRNLMGLLSTGTTAQKNNAKNQLAKLGYNFGGNSNAMGTVLTPAQMQAMSNAQAFGQYDTTRSGYIDDINMQGNKLNQLDSNAEIEQDARNSAWNQYVGQYDGIGSQARSAEGQYKNSLSQYDNEYNAAKTTLDENAGKERGRNLAGAAKRGLYNSSIVDQLNSITNTNQTKAVAEALKSKSDKVDALNQQITTLVNGLQDNLTSLTGQEAGLITQTISSLTKERDKQASDLNALINADRNKINTARNGMSTTAQSIYNTLYGQSQDQYNKNRDFNENKRQFNENLALQKKKIADDAAAAKKAAQSYSYGGNSTKSSTKSKSTTSSPKYSGSTSNKASSSTGISNSDKLKLGLGPISDSEYLKLIGATPKSTKQAMSDYTKNVLSKPRLGKPTNSLLHFGG